MTSLVFNFKDIASRMKGELKAAPEVVEAVPTPSPKWRDMMLQRAVCYKCHGAGMDASGNCCYLCMGSGVMP